jgi:hypothetical protein
LSTFARPPSRSVFEPEMYFEMKLWNVSWFAAPMRVIGVVVVFALPKTLRKVWKPGSGASAGDFREALVVGTFWIPFESFASAGVLVPRYLTSSQAWSLCLEVFGMPMMLPVT